MYYWKPFNKRRLRRFYSRFISEGDLCFDIGAHLGNRTNAWLDLGATVVAVEPQPDCVSFMKNKFRNNSKVSVISCAVGSETGRSTLKISKLTPTISTMSDEAWQEQINSDAWYEVKWDEEMVVDVVTLDTLIAEHGVPRFCKIDVENYELQVLEGLSSAIPQISFEYYPPYTATACDCIDRLEELGDYEYNWSFGETQKLNSTRWLGPEALKHIINGYSNRNEYGDIYARAS